MNKREDEHNHQQLGICKAPFYLNNQSEIFYLSFIDPIHETRIWRHIRRNRFDVAGRQEAREEGVWFKAVIGSLGRISRRLA